MLSVRAPVSTSEQRINFMQFSMNVMQLEATTVSWILIY
jgi:hypothetical protein